MISLNLAQGTGGAHTSQTSSPQRVYNYYNTECTITHSIFPNFSTGRCAYFSKCWTRSCVRVVGSSRCKDAPASGVRSAVGARLTGIGLTTPIAERAAGSTSTGPFQTDLYSSGQDLCIFIQAERSLCDRRSIVFENQSVFFAPIAWPLCNNRHRNC